MTQPVDPVTPHAAFESFAFPKPRKAQIKLRSRGAHWVTRIWSKRRVIGTSVICVLTFFLGMLVAMKVAGPKTQVANAAPPTAVVTRQQAPDLTSTVSAALNTAQEIPALEAAVLKGLQPKPTVGKLTADEMTKKALEAQRIVNRNKLRMLREGVLAGVYRVTAKSDGDIRRLVLTTVNAEMTQKAMGNLLLEAAKAGDIEVPASLTTAEGQVDMDTLLFNLIQTSLANDGTSEGAAAAKEMSRRAFAASDAKTQEVRGSRIYVVERGDSLAYLSLQFYGRPGAYMRIFQANREQLRSPDLIRIGQRLIIPG